MAIIYDNNERYVGIYDRLTTKKQQMRHIRQGVPGKLLTYQGSRDRCDTYDICDSAIDIDVRLGTTLIIKYDPPNLAGRSTD